MSRRRGKKPCPLNCPCICHDTGGYGHGPGPCPQQEQDYQAMDSPAYSRPAPTGAAPSWAAAYAVGGDHTEPEVTEVAVVRRRTLPAAPTARRSPRP